MVKNLLVFFVLIIVLSACQQDTSDNQTQEGEGRLHPNGKSENWVVEANITTKVLVTSRTNSVTVKPLDSKGEIDLKSSSLYEDDIEVEYFLEQFEAEGKEILTKGEAKLTFLFEGGVPYSDDESEYELTIKWIIDGKEKEEIIILN